MPDGDDIATERLIGEVRQALGEIKGRMDGVLHEVARIGGQIEQHVADDRMAHADQDSRMLKELRALSGRIAILEEARAKADGERSWRRWWGEAIRMWMAGGIGALLAWGLERLR